MLQYCSMVFNGFERDAVSSVVRSESGFAADQTSAA
jgi:hypothetical protein